ncbi:MAG: formate/nitrite transporter family protein [Treponema sp.]|nr:formate/nitrite transporter family protein [Treponema sp.]
MFKEEIIAVSNSARDKYNFLSTNPAGYIFASILAGIYVGFGVLLAFTVGSLLSGNPITRILMGCTFGIALSLVVMAGAELFTGNIFVMSAGLGRKTVSFSMCLKIFGMGYFGNFLGSVLLAAIFVGCGLAAGDTGEFISSIAAAKMSLPPLALICRAVLCNMLVCIAIWCAFRCKSETAKLIVIFWCLLAFITSGYEHSIANMTLLTISLLSPVVNTAVSLSGWIYNIALSTVGNIIGGVFLVLSYLLIARKVNP